MVNGLRGVQENWTVIGRLENGQPIGVNVHSHSVDHFEDLLQRYVGEVAVDFLSIIHPLQCIHGYNNNNIGEKKTIFMSNMLTNYILIHLQ